MRVGSYSGMIGREDMMSSRTTNKPVTQMQQEKDKQNIIEQQKEKDKKTMQADKEKGMAYAPSKPNMMDKKQSQTGSVDMMM